MKKTYAATTIICTPEEVRKVAAILSRRKSPKRKRK